MSDKDLPVIDLQFVPVGEPVVLHFADDIREILAPYQKLVDEGKARWPDPPTPRWPAVASVSWQDHADTMTPMVIPEAISRPVNGGDIVVLHDGSDGADDPMVALGIVARVDSARGLVTFRRLTPIFRPTYS